MTKEQFIKELEIVQEPLRRFLHGLCGGDSFKADDLAQEAMLKAYLSFAKYEGRAKFSTWLFRIAYNCYFDQYRHCPDVDETSVEKVQNNIRDGRECDYKFEYQQLYMAIANLSPVEKSVILLFYMEEKSIKEIGIIMDMPAGTIKSHLSRARNHLKDYLETKSV